MIRIAIIVLFCLIQTPASHAALPPDVSLALSQAGIPEDGIGLFIQDIASGEVAAVQNTDAAFNPASVMKVLTTLAALDQLGPAHTWKTRVLYSGNIERGVLQGDLILQGGGDPSLTQERFWALLREVREKGIREIRGDVILDNSFYGIDLEDPSAFDEAPLKPYNAAPTALLVNFNVLTLRLSPIINSVKARLDPPGLPVISAINLDKRASCNGWQEDIDIHREGDQLLVVGRYPLACGDRSLWLNLMCPPATAATFFKTTWQGLGGVFTGQIRIGRTPEDTQLWLEHNSEPLSLIIRDVNKFSNNVMAKMLLLNLGADRYGAPATWEKGQAAIHAWLAEKGMNFPELVVENGSGLSRIARISPGSLGQLLAWAARQPLYYEFAASLPALGMEGTQKKRLRDSPLAGRAWLKSGSLNGVRNLAGYYMDVAGRRKLLVLFIQHANSGQAAQAQEAILEWALGQSARVESAYSSLSGR